MKILLMEDDPGINELLTFHLKSKGYEVVSTVNGQEALEAFNETIQLAILDIMVPKVDGFQVLEAIRRISQIPILFLTAMDSEVDKLKALGLGADDYVTKPFSFMEVLYRVNALIRRAYDYQANKVTKQVIHKGLVFHVAEHSVTLDGQSLELNAKEYELLLYLASNPGQVFTKKQLYEQVWGESFYGDDNTVMVHISRLREKLKDDSKEPLYIKTLKGLGYRMEKS